jgi:superfamily II DNA or RNA helicase|tara:strand:+ start:555 stop:1997 length:1443 start_codon:yes stop_codon:yes gene_type:complete
MISIKYLDDVHCKVECDSSTAQELGDFFTFDVPGAKFMPAVRNRVWDGKIRLFNQITRTVYVGLVDYIVDFARVRGYDIESEGKLTSKVPFDIEDVNHLAQSIGLTMEARDYQKKAVAHAISNKRSVLLSPTASGKSLIIYMLARYYPARKLVIVPTTGLVHQMASDFAEYGYTDECHKITAGASKEIESEITISTWQSIYKLPKDWFSQFQVVIGDEAHLFKAKSLTTIMSKLVVCPYKFGFTGTLDDSNTHKLVLEGLFGPVESVIKTAELIKQKYLAELKINICVLEHTLKNRSEQVRATYRDEINFIVGNRQRNEFLLKLCSELEGNTLLLFGLVEKHGKVLHEMASKLDRRVFFVHGGVPGQARDEIRSIVESEDRALIVASYGTFSTGVNIKRLNNVVFASPSKSKIRVLQSIGRGLRRSDSKVGVRLYDIVDDLRKGSWVNFTARHYRERVKIYNDEQFPYKIHTYKLKQEKQ